MEKEKLLSKIRKLLSLGSSSNPNEASLALSKARELMNEYNISEEDLAIHEVTQKDSSSKHGASSLPIYLSILVSVIGDLFQCRYYLKSQSHWKNGRFHNVCFPVFVGKDIDVEVCTYTYDVLHKKLSKARREYKPSGRLTAYEASSSKDSYALGWVQGAANNVVHLIPPKRKIDIEENGELITVDPIELYLQKMELDSAKKKKQKPVDPTSRILGEYDGSKVHISKAANEGAKSKAIKSAQ